jgi:hypothetical protein
MVRVSAKACFGSEPGGSIVGMTGVGAALPLPLASSKVSSPPV